MSQGTNRPWQLRYLDDKIAFWEHSAYRLRAAADFADANAKHFRQELAKLEMEFVSQARKNKENEDAQTLF